MKKTIMNVNRERPRVNGLAQQLLGFVGKEFTHNPECGETLSNSSLGCKHTRVWRNSATTHSGSHIPSVENLSPTLLYMLIRHWYQLDRCLHTPFALPVDLGLPKYLTGNVHAVAVIPDVAGITHGHLITFLFRHTT